MYIPPETRPASSVFPHYPAQSSFDGHAARALPRPHQTGVGISLARRPSLSIAAFAAGLLGTLLAGAVLVPRCGATGAAVSQLLGFLVYFVVKTELGMRVWRPLPRRALYLSAVLLSLLAAFRLLRSVKQQR